MPQHEKYAPLSDSAFRLAITAGAWCASMMTDGRLPKKMISGLTRAPAGKKLNDSVSELIAARIWDRIEDDDTALYVHDFLDWNMSRAQWQAKKAAGSAGGKAKAAAKSKQPPKQKASKRLAPASNSLEQTASTSSSVPLADSDLRSPIPISDPNSQKEELPASPDGKQPAEKTDRQQLIEHYFEVFTEKRGDRPCFSGREGKSVSKLLASVGGDLDRAKTAITNAFDSFFADNATINTIASDPSKFLGSRHRPKQPGLFSPPQPNAKTNRPVIPGL